MIFKSTDRGAGWTSKTKGLPASWQSEGSLTIVATNPPSIFVNVGDGLLYKSVNGGESWRGLTVGQGAWIIGPEAFDPLHPSTVYTALVARIPQPWQDEDLYLSTLLKSTDAGDTWSETKTSLPGSITSLAVDPSSTIYASNIPDFPYLVKGVVVKSTDGGRVEPRQHRPPIAHSPILSLALNPANPSAIFAGYFDVSPAMGAAASSERLMEEKLEGRQHRTGHD